VFPTSWQGWLIVISLAGVCQILGQGMLVRSLNELSSEFVALFLLLEPVLAGVGAWALFSEQLSLLNLVAFAIALVGVYLSLSSPSALRDEAIQPTFATLQVETDPKNRDQEVTKGVLNGCVAKNA
jgi:drug/metabolite transporter (DMT)-like permease